MNDNADPFSEACSAILQALQGLDIRVADELLDLGRRMSFWLAALGADLETIAGQIEEASKALQVSRVLDGFLIGDRMLIVEHCRRALWTSAFPGCAAFQTEEEAVH